MRLLEDKCKGCTNCIKRCPTEAIRVREGKAVISVERCIDCGECVRTCENHAKAVITSSLDDLMRFDYRIAVPAPTLYGQIRRAQNPDEVVWALLQLGFDSVCDVSYGADIATECIRRYVSSHPEPRPLISAACPAVVRLIQVRFPGLIPHIARVESPMYAAARVSRLEAARSLGIDDARIGVFFITPCAAKVTSAIAPVGSVQSYVDGAISIADIYGQIVSRLGANGVARPMHRGSSLGFGWARNGGELRAIGIRNSLAVDGIHNVLGVLEEADGGRLSGVDYIEALACPAGCVGGPVTVENPFVARVRMREISESLEGNTAEAIASAIGTVDELGEEFFSISGEIPPLSGLELDACLETAIMKMSELERMVEGLPGLDCGACGSPTCRSHAEDIACGRASEIDCVFKLRERMQEVAEELLRLAKKDVPSMGKREGKSLP
ncbi:MAG: [Fe-Fe] hydrogenase large subunit C-terminal domain-containing protein [Clostridia bacterium]|nr:[Fe-Fe] hydrogenase large subunit C-terminal domain-containing protein [Clostridia bacterium]